MNLETAKAKLAEQSADQGTLVKVIAGDKTYRVTEIKTENSTTRGQTVWIAAEPE
jgi:hypothetical protein